MQFFFLRRRDVTADLLLDRKFFLTALFYKDRMFLADVKMLYLMDCDQVPGEEILGSEWVGSERFGSMQNGFCLERFWPKQFRS